MSRWLTLLSFLFISVQAFAIDWEYQIVMIDARWPERPFVILVSKTNTYGISSLEEMLKQDLGYIGVPNGKVVRGPEEGPLHKWNFHIDADTVEFGDASIEVCDGDFEYVESNLDEWIRDVGQYCPWNASNNVVQIWKGPQMIYGVELKGIGGD